MWSRCNNIPKIKFLCQLIQKLYPEQSDRHTATTKTLPLPHSAGGKKRCSNNLYSFKEIVFLNIFIVPNWYLSLFLQVHWIKYKVILCFVKIPLFLVNASVILAIWVTSEEFGYKCNLVKLVLCLFGAICTNSSLIDSLLGNC